jgi:hypothetical protein
MSKRIKKQRSKDAWKRHERLIASYFNTTRNIFGRGKFGFTSTDIVAKLDDELWNKICLENRIEYDSNLLPTHLIIECKYNTGRDGPLFKSMSQAQDGCGAIKAYDRYLISRWKNVTCSYLSDFPRVFTEVLLPMYMLGKEKISVDLSKIGVHHNCRRLPGYVKKYVSQVKKDTEACWDQNRDWIPMYLVCMGNSSKDKIVIYDNKQTYKDYTFQIK